MRRVDMTGHDRDVLGDPAVGDRDAGQRRHRRRAGHSRDDLAGHPGGRAGQRLLAAATEDERVAALEAHHPQAASGAFHDHLVDLLLGEVVAVRRLAGIHDLDLGL